MSQVMPAKGRTASVRASVEGYQAVREASLALARPLSAEDQLLQSMPDASPTKWHLAHTTWFFETFVLSEAAPELPPFDASFRVLFNSYYHGVGEMHPRPQRGLLSRPSLSEVHAYRAHVDHHMEARLRAGGFDSEQLARIELGLHHEQQHQELIVTDIKHAFGQHPGGPVYRPLQRPSSGAPAWSAGLSSPTKWRGFAGGLHSCGHEGEAFAFDNETPLHSEYLQDFELASRPVTCSEYLGFMADGGYERFELWLAQGWDAIHQEGWRAPAYWHRESDESDWQIYTLHGTRPVEAEEPVCHLSFYEADAYARWVGARLPSEAEWEVAARAEAVRGHFADDGILHPRAAPESGGLQQIYGDVWEWTASPYVAYPGFRPAEGAVGEYNGKFMCDQWVLRGGSCASPQAHLRPTYRNFFPGDARWQFSGLRLARDA